MLSNKKEHYKMYKSGKMWVYSSVVIATLLGGATTVSADTSSNATSNVSSASSASSTATQATTSSLNSKTTNKAEINAKDTTLVAGPNTKWTAEDNFVSATDQTGKDVAFTSLTTEGSVDTKKAGQYAITYKFTDVDGTVVSKTITVTVEKSKSKIETKDSTLVTGSNTKWSAGDNFISATDQNGSSIDLKDIQVSGSVDTTKAGKYSVTYSYQDNSGNEVSQIATVTVVNNETSKNVDSNTKNNVALRSITAAKEVSGVNVTTSFQNDDTFSNGTGTIALNVVIDKTATIKKGSVLSFKISNPDAINWNNIQLNGGTNYGSLTYDQQSGTIKYTFNVDVVNGDINFIVNIHPTAADINNTTISSDVDGVLVPISGGTSFNNKKSSDNGGGTYNEQRLIIGNGSYGFSGTPENYVGYINGKNYYLPNRQSMNYNIVLDPGFYTEKENDKTGRKIQLTISGSNASIDLDSLYITEKGGYPNTSQSYVSLKSMGWTFKQISPTSVEIDIPDGFNMGWYLLGIVPKTPDLDSEYKLTANYSSDAVTAAQTTSTSGYFQNISNKGFVPQITAEDKSINRSSNNSNLSDWLLNNVSASDVEDGNLDNKISITDDQDFLDAWNKNENGSYKVTYSVTDKDGNTTTKIINVTIYSNITIHYVDQDGKALQSDTTLIANSNGETYSITPVTTITKENNVYNYVSASASLNGTYGSNNQPTEITLTYHASQATIAAKDSTLVAGPNTRWTASDNFISATDQDGNPVELKDITVKGSVDTTKAGHYDVTYSYTDASGNQVSKTITVTVVDSKAGIDAKDSTLVAGPNTKWTAGDNFESATDQAGNPIELKDLQVSGSVDTNKAGKYEITYSYTDASGNQVSKTITVTVVASKATIAAKDSTLVAGPNTKWTAGDNFESATDQAGNPIELKDLQVSGSVDTNKAGKYEITYSYTDASGNQVSKTITVTVVASKATIAAKDSTLVAGPNTKWTAGDNFESATDQAGNPIELKDLQVSGSVDTNKAGKYEITYSYTDASGNQVSKTITVTVVASKATIAAKDSTLVAGPNTRWTASDNFISATDQDGNPIELKDLQVSGSVDTNKAGKYEITYSYTDASGNQVSKTITVTVVASKATIAAKDSTLVAGPNTKWTASDNFISATDQAGNPIELKDLQVSGSVDTNKAGKYEITYSYTDASGNQVSKTITVTVVASKATIAAKDSTLVAGPNTKWTASDNFISATDQAGNPIELKDLQVSGSVDTNKAGKYEITYSYTDASGNQVSKTITVTVVASKATIAAKDSTLVAGPNTKWTASDNFISATDQAGNPIELKDLQVSGSVDTNKAGKYEITYSYTDASGNQVSKTITVTVVASKATIAAKDSTLVAGPNTKWTASDNFISATDQDGNPIELKDLQVSGSVDTNKAGKYEITYSYTDANGNLVSKTITVTVLALSSDSGSKSSISKTPDSPTVKVSYRVTKNNNNGNKQLPDTSENSDGFVGSIVGAIFAASLGILTIINKKKNDN